MMANQLISLEEVVFRGLRELSDGSWRDGNEKIPGAQTNSQSKAGTCKR